MSSTEDGGAVGIVPAYVHPCASVDHLLLDSDTERRTLEHLRSTQRWLSCEDGVVATIEKATG